MTRNERFQFVLDYFQQHAPHAETELIYDTPYQLLVSVILSAQCTDKRVNMTTPAIFERYPTPQALAKAGFDELFPLIRSISYPNNKTKHLIGMAQMLVKDFHGEVPLTVDELVQLPGVGRKTANVITSVVDNQPNMAVDTHVFRVSARLGLTLKATTPLRDGKTITPVHSPRSRAHRPSLADPSWSVIPAYCAYSQMRNMRARNRPANIIRKEFWLTFSDHAYPELIRNIFACQALRRRTFHNVSASPPALFPRPAARLPRARLIYPHRAS